MVWKRMPVTMIENETVQAYWCYKSRRAEWIGSRYNIIFVMEAGSHTSSKVGYVADQGVVNSSLICSSRLAPASTS